MVNQYEQIRKQNVLDNRRILAELGILNPFKPLGRVIKKSVKRKRHNSGSREWQPKKQAVEEVDTDDYGSIRGTRRRSSRILGKDVPTEEDLKDEVDKFVEDGQRSHGKVKANRPKFYGSMEDVEVGTLWQTRLEACQAGVHRPTVAGIHGGEDGAYSIALSGGYEDDIDLGECFTYTGEGGRDLKGTKANPKNLRTAAQSKDQTLTRGNLALSRNVETGNLVRVLRGYKLRSPFAPEEGYRYDGVYSVEKAWFTTGLSSFGVWKFALRRSADQPPPPWSFAECEENSTSPNKCKEESNLFKVKTTKSESKDVSVTSSDNLAKKVEHSTKQETEDTSEPANETTPERMEEGSSDDITKEARSVFAQSSIVKEEEMEQTTDSIKDNSENGVASIKDNSENGVASIKDNSENGVASIKDNSENGVASIKNFENGVASIKNSENGVASIKDNVENGVASIKNNSENDVDSIKDNSENVVASISDKPENGVASVKDKSENGVASISDKPENGVASISDKAENGVASSNDNSENGIASINDNSENDVASSNDNFENGVASTNENAENGVAPTNENSENDVVSTNETMKTDPTSDTKTNSDVDSDSGVNSECRISSSQSSEGSVSSLSE